MQRHSLLVLTTPFEGSDDEFNRWYDEQHLADVLDLTIDENIASSEALSFLEEFAGLEVGEEVRHGDQ